MFEILFIFVCNLSSFFRSSALKGCFYFEVLFILGLSLFLRSWSLVTWLFISLSVALLSQAKISHLDEWESALDKNVLDVFNKVLHRRLHIQ